MLGQIDMAKSKLNILYLMKQVGKPMDELNIAHGMIENDLMEYFSFKQFMAELEEAAFIEKQVILDAAYYSLTEHGIRALDFFNSRMMGSEKKMIEKYVAQNLDKITRYQEIYTDYKKIGDSRYRVEIKIMENKTEILSFATEVPSKKICMEILAGWNEDPSRMYMDLMNFMITNKTEGKRD